MHQSNQISMPAMFFGVFVVAGISVGQVSPQPRCTTQIVYPTTQTASSSDCHTYSECEADSLCLSTGGAFKSCGPLETFDRYCFDFVGGVYNPETGRCEGGVWSGPAYVDKGNQVNVYTTPEPCPGSGPA